MKKTISCLIIALLVFSNIGFIANATENTNELSFTSDIKELSELGIIKGDESGNLNEDKILSRAEFAALLTRALKLSASDKTSEFTDVVANHWASGSITAAKEAKLMQGYPDGSFNPDGKILFEEAVKTFVHILGYGEKAAQNAAYPWGELLVAADLGITKGTNGATGEMLTRGVASTLLLKTLYTKTYNNANAEYLINVACPEVFFVSTNGSDDNDGSYAKPWKSFAKAASSLKNGQTAIFEDGTYIEDDTVNLMGENITLRSRNQYGANIVFAENAETGINISEDAASITVKGFGFTNETTKTVINNAANKAVFEGNKISGVLNTSHAQSTVIKNNYFEGGCVVAKACDDILLTGNKFYNAFDFAISLNEDCADIRINNNMIVTNEKSTKTGMLLDGVLHCAIWNNVIAGADSGVIEKGIVFGGMRDADIFNNVISKVSEGIVFDKSQSGAKPGFAGADINLKNNIFSDTKGNAYIFNSTPDGFVSDYNMYYEAYPELEEINSIYSFPDFVNSDNDWHIIDKSKAAYSGTDVIKEMNGKLGTYMLDMTDMNGYKSDEKISMGAFGYIADSKEQTGLSGMNETIKRYQPAGALLMSNDFSNKEMPKWSPKVGDWVVEDGVLKQILSSAGRSFMIYNEGYAWTDCAISVDVKSPKQDGSSNVGVAFRQSEDAKNSYVFRIQSSKVLELAKWVNGKFASIKTWNYSLENDKVYNLGVELNGKHITLYINGAKVGEVEDTSHSIGTVAMYSYVQESVFDNLKVTALE